MATLPTTFNRRIVELQPELPPAAPGKNGTFAEPLLELGRFAYEMADQLCDAGAGCVDYHRVWSMVRLMESDGALPAGQEFFDAELPKAARDGEARVILSGAADTGLMALAVNACHLAGIKPRIVMTDRCRTPLAQGEIFANQIGVDFQSVQTDIIDLSVPPADAILAHSFLAFIPHQARADVFASWARNLRTGGRVLMSQRLVPEGEVYTRKRPPEKIAERREQLAEVFDRLRPVNGSPADFLEAAERLWTHSFGGNGVSESQLVELCNATGFRMDKVVYDDGARSVSPFALPSEAAKRKRAGIVLIKED